MTEKNQTTATPLALALPISKLKGWLSKHIQVPPGRKGISLFRNGSHALYDSGENRVLTDLDRLKGDGAGFWAGYIPKGPFSALLTIDNLISADQVLLDFSLLCSLEVSDAVLFFTEVVIPRGSIPGQTYLMDDPELFKVFSNSMRSYLAEDLVGGKLDAELINKSHAALNAILSNKGLALQQIDLLTCWRKEDRLVIEEQLFALERKMSDLEFEKKLAAVEDQAELDHFLEEYSQPLTGKTRLADKQGKKKDKNSAEIVGSFIEGKNQAQQPGSNFRVKSLLIKKTLEDAKHKDQTRFKPRWWLPRVLWIVLVLLIAAVLTYFLNRASATHAWAGRSEFYIAIWTFAIGALLESAVTLFKNWEKLFDKDVEAVDAIGLDQLRLKDRLAISQLVQEQCTMELDLQKDILNELRSRVYHSGNTDLALEMRRIETKIEDFQQKIKDKYFGTPAYLQEGVKISEKTWMNQMDKEELLLIQAALLSDESHGLQEKFSQSELNADHLRQFEANLDTFYKNFALRERILHSPELD